MANDTPVSFGPFVFDPRTGDLRRNGSPVRLQAQPAQVLAALIRRHGQIVSREALRHAIWDTDTFVDFDRGLNFCIAQIRSTLGDSADSPTYIRTHPKRGYEFIAGVALVRQPGPELPVVAGPVLRGRRLLLAVSAMLIAGIGVFLSIEALRSGKLVRSTIAVVRFDNETGDPGLTRFADNVTDQLVAELTTDPQANLDVIGNAAILRLPREGRDLKQIAASLKAGLIVMGQVQRTGDGVRILAHLIRMPDQKHVFVVRREAGAQDLIPRQSELASGIASDLVRRLRSAPPTN